MESWSKILLETLNLLNPRQRNLTGIRAQFFRQRNKPKIFPKTSITHRITGVHEAGPIRTGYCVPSAIKVLVSKAGDPAMSPSLSSVNNHPQGEKVSKPKLTFL